MLKITSAVHIPENEIEITAIRSQGAGGQNVNKVASAVHLRFDIQASSLPEFYKERLLKKKDHRITADGVIIIKAQQFRSQEKNREDALRRLQLLIRTYFRHPFSWFWMHFLAALCPHGSTYTAGLTPSACRYSS